MNAPRPDEFDLAIRSGAINALRRRASALRQRAAPGVVVLDRDPVVVIVDSKSAHLFRIAKSFADIADDLEAEGL